MGASIDLETQGISDDWLTADGDFEAKSRGAVDKKQLLSGLSYLARLDEPDGDDVCPPHALTQGPAGSFSFVGQGGGDFLC